MTNRIIWFTGTSKAGKTTLARLLQKEWPCIILDGDEMRDSVSLDTGFSREDRREHNFRVARLARELVKQMNVVVSVIAPMREVREEISRICNPQWVYICNTILEGAHRDGHFYERPMPEETPWIIRTDLETERESLMTLLALIKIESISATDTRNSSRKVEE